MYAYLSSKFGVPQVISGTYGAIIQHIEPQHIAGLPVPRFDEKLERRVHELVEAAAELRASAAKGLREVRGRFDKLVREVGRFCVRLRECPRYPPQRYRPASTRNSMTS